MSTARHRDSGARGSPPRFRPNAGRISLSNSAARHPARRCTRVTVAPSTSRHVDNAVDLVAGGDIVRNGDSTPRVAVVVDASVFGELITQPEDEDEAVGPVESRLLDVEGR